MLRSLDDLKSHQVMARDGQLGGIEDFLYDEDNWSLRFLVVNTGSWLTGRKVLVSPTAVEEADGETQTVTIGLTHEQIEDGPSIDEASTVSRRMEREFSVVYGWPAPLQAPLQPVAPEAFGDPRPADARTHPTTVAETPGTDDERDLRSFEEVTGYHIRAVDEEIGHVDDMIVEEDTWTIRYLVVDTRNVLPGKKVLLVPNWVERISWSDRKLHVDVTRRQVEESPEFHPEAPINRRVEEKLYDFYGRPVYWEKRVPSGSPSR